MRFTSLKAPMVLGAFFFSLSGQAGFTKIYTWEQDESLGPKSGNPVRRVVNDSHWTYAGNILSSPWAETYVEGLRSTELSGYAVKQTVEAIHGVHTLAVITETHDQWAANLQPLIDQGGVHGQRAAQALNEAETRPKVWLFPSYEEEQNAYFAPDGASSGDGQTSDAIVTGWYKVGDKIRHVCRSTEVLAHEAGHRCHFLTHPQSQYEDSWDQEVGAFGEGYGDFRAFVYNVNSDFQISRIMKRAGGKMDHPAFWRVADLAEQFGTDLGYQDGLRSARHDYRMPYYLTTDEVNVSYDLPATDGEIHALGRVWNTAIYDVVADVYGQAAELERNYKNEAVPLLQEITNAMDTLISATLLDFGAWNSSPSFSDVATGMWRLIETGVVNMPYQDHGRIDWKESIHWEFGRRGVLVRKEIDAHAVRSVSADRRVTRSMTQHARHFVTGLAPLSRYGGHRSADALESMGSDEEGALEE